LGDASGQGSRAVKAALRAGEVAVNDVVVRDGARQLPATASVTLRGEVLACPPRLAMWHKPVGTLSTHRDPWGRAGVETAPGPLGSAPWHPVGRLDQDTSGLLLFSRDGGVTQHLLHPRRAWPRTYVAEVEGAPDASLRARLAEGVETADGPVCAEVIGLDGARVTLTVTEGRYRMVRRMLANAGHPVLALHRLAYAGVQLGDLAPGAWRWVDDAEVGG
jgi:23S rRNA pseudouridine2605 synthase